MTNETAAEEKNRRIGISLDAEQSKRFLALAEFDKKKPATLAAEIIKRYMLSRAADIDSILHVREVYEKNVADLRDKARANLSVET